MRITFEFDEEERWIFEAIKKTIKKSLKTNEKEWKTMLAPPILKTEKKNRKVLTF